MGRLAISKSHLAPITLCLAFVFALGLSYAKSRPFTVDDSYSVRRLYHTRHHPIFSVNETIRTVAALPTRNITPLYHAVLNLWARYTGRDLFTLRALSVLFGLLAISITCRLALLSGKAEALDTVVILSFLAFYLFYTQIARFYALFIPLVPWVIWSYWRALHAAPQHYRLAWISLVVSATAILYTYLVGAFILAAVGIYHLAFVPKNRRWATVVLGLGASGLLFLPWLPVAFDGVTMWTDSVGGSLPIVDALVATLSVHSNGLIPLIPIAGLIILRQRQRLGDGQRFILALSCIVLVLMLAANERTALFIERRMRYTLVLSSLWCVALAIGLNYLPYWRYLRVPALIAWIAAFLTFWGSDDMRLYNNSLTLRHDDVPNYQYLIYEPTINPRSSDFVLSFHQDAPFRSKHTLHYYGNMTGSWRGIIQLWNSDADDAALLSSDPRYNDLQSMADVEFPHLGNS